MAGALRTNCHDVLLPPASAGPALVKREWLILGDEPGKITASYDRREFTSRIGIAYDTVTSPARASNTR